MAHWLQYKVKRGEKLNMVHLDQATHFNFVNFLDYYYHYRLTPIQIRTKPSLIRLYLLYIQQILENPHAPLNTFELICNEWAKMFQKQNSNNSIFNSKQNNDNQKLGSIRSASLEYRQIDPWETGNSRGPTDGSQFLGVVDLFFAITSHRRHYT